MAKCNCRICKRHQTLKRIRTKIGIKDAKILKEIISELEHAEMDNGWRAK